ncbi:alpha/beta hydrolase [Robiginitalea sp. IMCC44478]|uniref:alpha/beta hydrolase n=1 Tax=Robiginitalea sp. IMCC44478 TaxID=3459122 RepID=UPI004041278E
MKKIYLLFFLTLIWVSSAGAQEVALKKGIVMDSLPFQDSVATQIRLFLPESFNQQQSWPLLFICDEEDKSLLSMRYLAELANKNGYILAASKNLQDSATLTDKILDINNTISYINGIFPLDNQRIIAGGFGEGGQLAVLLPSMLKKFKGSLAVASLLPNTQFMDSKAPYPIALLIGLTDSRYVGLASDKVQLRKMYFPFFVQYFNGGHQWPAPVHINKALQFFTLTGMAKKQIPLDLAYVQSRFDDYLEYIDQLIATGDLITAMEQIEEGINIYRLFEIEEPLWTRKKRVRKMSAYKSQRREASSLQLKESLMREDYLYYLEEDLERFNLNNLGWWNYQMGVLSKFKDSEKLAEKRMGERLQDYVNTLINEYIRFHNAQEPIDDDSLILLYMLKTITESTDFEAYLRVVSLTSKYEDYGTALFYLEEALKKGFTDKQKLYELEHTALLRISPEFNELVSKYLEDARYD